MEEMEKIKKPINIALSGILGILVLVVIVAGVQIMQGKHPQILGYSFYHVMTGSMEPTIATNANVVVKAVDATTLEVGDIITFQSEDEAIYGSANTHRIIEVTTDEDGELCFITQGDANPIADDIPVYPEDIYGKVVFYTTAIYWISVFFAFAQTGVGFITVVVLPIMLVGYFYMKDFVKSLNTLIATQAAEQIEEEQTTELQEETKEV